MALQVGFVGVGNAAPGAGEEGTCFVVNDTILVDTGFNVAVSLQALDIHPTAIDHVFFTHCHQDHTLGLPGLLFANRDRQTLRPDAGPLTLYGPLDLPAVRDGALALLQADRYPQAVPAHEVRQLYPGDSVELGELRIDVGRAFHPIDARSYRLTDTATRGSIVITGDTAYHEGLSAFAKGCDVLIHEAAAPPEADEISMRYLHSRPQEAGRVAQEAGASTLALVHYPATQAAAVLTGAKKTFPNSRLARAGQRVRVLGPGQAAWV